MQADSPHDMPERPTDDFLRRILSESRTIACVGVSLNPVRPSFFVARYLHLRGYHVIPVNPAHAGGDFFGRTIYASLGEIPGDAAVDMVDIFRRPEFVPDLVAEAIECLSPSLKTVWMQVGVSHREAAASAESAGLRVVQDRCPKIEHQRLYGELRKMGFNTGVISSKL